MTNLIRLNIKSIYISYLSITEDIIEICNEDNFVKLCTK